MSLCVLTPNQRTTSSPVLAREKSSLTLQGMPIINTPILSGHTLASDGTAVYCSIHQGAFDQVAQGTIPADTLVRQTLTSLSRDSNHPNSAPFDLVQVLTLILPQPCLIPTFLTP